jgi:hypothetical protein
MGGYSKESDIAGPRSSASAPWREKLADQGVLESMSRYASAIESKNDE